MNMVFISLFISLFLHFLGVYVPIERISEMLS